MLKMMKLCEWDFYGKNYDVIKIKILFKKEKQVYF